MTPERAASVFRELMLTPREEYGHFARRAGLHTQPEHLDLEQAQELLYVIAQALESNPGPSWERVRSAWTGMRARHGQAQIGIGQSSGLEPKPPAWVRDLPAKPMLGDPAPGTAGFEDQQEKRARFVPVAQPGLASGPPPAQYAAPPAKYAAPQPYPASAAAPPAYGESYASSPGHGVQPAGYPRGEVHHAGAADSPPAAYHGAPAAQAPAGSSHEDTGWTVSKYAAFCAACAAFPDRVLQTQQQYGVADATARARLDDWWADRFDDDPGLQEQWERMFAQFRDQLRRRG